MKLHSFLERIYKRTNATKMKHIICFHLFNDYSGSPKVLKNILQSLLDEGYNVDLITSKGGILDSLVSSKGILKRTTYHYPKFSTYALEAVIRYSIYQIYTFCIAWRYLFKKDAVFYINTILPIGPAIAGRLMAQKVIYHYHENAFIKSTFYRLLCRGMCALASQIICVSQYQRSFLKRQKGVYTIPNALPPDFASQLTPHIKKAFERKNILMLSSLKTYKGISEFIQLSQKLPQYEFTLVINDTQAEIDSFIKKQSIIPGGNLLIVPRQSNVTPFYNYSSLVLNLSNKKKIIETFGLTVLEAMAAGLPVIVPTQGGIAEMVDNNVNGYKIDVQELEKIANTIVRVFSDESLYRQLATNALKHSKLFNNDNIIKQIIAVLKH